MTLSHDVVIVLAEVHNGLHELGREGCSSICDDDLGSTMSQEDRMYEETCYLHRGAAGKGLCFGEVV